MPPGRLVLSLAVSQEIARAQLVGPVMESLLREVDFGRLQPGHLPHIQAVVREKLAEASSAAVRRQLGGQAGVDAIGQELAEDVLCSREFFALIQDPSVTAVVVNGPHEVRSERGSERQVTNLSFPSERSLNRVAMWMTAQIDQCVHAGRPLVEARLPDGSQIQAIVPPVAPGGTVLCIRRSPLAGADLGGLAAAGCFPLALVPLLHAVVAGRLNLLVSGPFGGSATILLSALAQSVPAEERLVLVEQRSELPLERPGLVRLQEGTGGDPSSAELVEAALALRPDRLVLPRLEGREIRNLLRAADGACAGSMAAVRAESIDAALEQVAAAAEPGPAGRRLVAAGVDVVLQMLDGPLGPRLAAIAEVQGFEGERVITQQLFSLEASPEGFGHTFTAAGLRPSFADRLERQGLRLPAELWRLRQDVA